MDSMIGLAVSNLTTPMILFFLLGLLAALTRSDLNVPEAIAKGMSLYLMLAIGFKGGAGVSEHGVDLTMVLSQALQALALEPEGYMVAVAAIMETPAIFVALWLARGKEASLDATTLREVGLNGSIVILTGSFFIGMISGAEGLASISAFIIAPFKGVLCLFLLDMGLIAGRGLREGRRNFTPSLLLFGLYMPLIGGVLGLGAGFLIGLSVGGSALMATLGASASYIAVPAAMRLALPEAKPSIYLPLSLGITFPFNLTIGIPLYIFLARAIH